MARIAALIVIIFEIIPLSVTIRKKDKECFKFYTHISNWLCLLSSALLAIFGQASWVMPIRYLSVCMLVITLVITVVVLLPMYKTIKLFLGRNLYYHLICPVLTTLSYIFLEYHVSTIWMILPVCVTLLYGFTMIYLNYKDKVDGPYPFFKINKIGKRMTAIWVVVILGVTAVLSGIVGYKPANKCDTKFIFVHGLAGWGSYDPLYEYYSYWGMAGGDSIMYLNNHGYESYAASVDPTGSAWDRACELYAQLYGTRVDYGLEHSERCNHERYGEDYTGRGLIKDFDGCTYILIGHSFGGATIRLFSEILRNGCPEETEYTTDGSLSDFFKGGKGDGLVAIVTLAAPTNGTTAYDLYEDPDFDVDSIYIDEEYLKHSDAVSNASKPPEDGRIGEDHAAFDMHIDNALALNDRITTFDDVYYFAIPFDSTYVGDDGKPHPDPDITENIFMRNAILMSEYTGSTAGGYEIDESWQANDGLVNTISAGAPIGAPSGEYVDGESLEKGIWYVMPVIHADHMSAQGGLTRFVSVKPKYLELVKMLSKLK